MTDLIFHDIISKQWPHSWSPFTIRTLLCLNHLKLSYIHHAVSYPDIADTLRQLNVPVPPELAEKTIQYTLPALTSSSKTTMGSFEIAEELASSSPEFSALLFPNGEKSKELTKKVGKALGDAMDGFWKHVIPFVPFILDDKGAEYFYRTREPKLGNLQQNREEALAEEKELGGLGEKVEEVVRPLWDVLERIEKEEDERESKGVFLGGRENPSYPDFVVVGLVGWWIAARGEGDIMGALEKVGEGRLAKIVKGCEHLLKPKEG